MRFRRLKSQIARESSAGVAKRSGGKGISGLTLRAGIWVKPALHMYDTEYGISPDAPRSEVCPRDKAIDNAYARESRTQMMDSLIAAMARRRSPCPRDA